jgi:poly-gamma-glutamate synthesis protein (capsule biosynthesis protein)
MDAPRPLFPVLLIAPLVWLGSLAACAKSAETPEPGAASAVTAAAVTEAKVEFLTIVAAGDNLYHDVMIRPPESGTYNFEPFYSEITDLILPADIAFINQETLMAGAEFGFSGYPRFNTPGEAGKALTAAGFDVFNLATNHIMDKGERAVFAAMDFWDSLPEAIYLGVHPSEEQRKKPVIIEKNNITTGFLAYTYGTNGIPVPRDKPWLVSLIDTEIMAEEIDALRPRCDFLVVSMHWGSEYRHDYSEEQKNLALFLAEHQVDLVIGHHPHVIQPLASLPRPGGKTMLCFYSLGNLISAQTRSPTLLGGIMYVRLKKDAAGITVEEARVVPTVTHYEENFTGFKVYPLYNYTEELAEKHRQKQSDKTLGLDYFTALARQVLGQGIIDYNPFYKYETKPNKPRRDLS